MVKHANEPKIPRRSPSAIAVLLRSCRVPLLALTTGLVALLGWPAVAGATAIGPVSPVPVVSEFSASPNGDPLGITAGPDGNLWYIEQDWKVGRITPTGAITDFSSGIDHEGSAAPFGDLQQIAAGPDGNLWATQFNGLVDRITPHGVVSHQPAGITPHSESRARSAGSRLTVS
jgi:streptogramin lyase